MGKFVAFLLLNESPDFIHLHISHVQVSDLLVHEPLATLTSQNEQAENRIAMNAGDPFGAPNAHAFQKQFQDHLSLIHRQAHFVQGTLVLFGEGFVALVAAEALEAVAVLSKALADDTAGMAGHGCFPLVF